MHAGEFPTNAASLQCKTQRPDGVDTVDRVGDEPGEALDWSPLRSILCTHSVNLCRSCGFCRRRQPGRTLIVHSGGFAGWWTPEVVGERLEVLGDGRKLELVSRASEPPQPLALEAMVDLEVGKPHLNFLARVARLFKLRGSLEGAGVIACFFVYIARNLPERCARASLLEFANAAVCGSVPAHHLIRRCSTRVV